MIASFPKNSNEKLVVSLCSFGGYELIDVRTHAVFDDSDEPKPTRKGISLRISKLPDLIEALLDARAKAQRRGLLSEEGAPTN